jgi:hypothetical protein
LLKPESELDLEGLEVDYSTRILRDLNILFFGKEHPQKSDRNGVRIEMLVSEHHLDLAADLGNNYSRGARPSILETSDHGWDAIALSILLNIIHDRHDKVPRSIDLELFAKIAVITDYFECADALAMAAEIWRSKIYDYETVDKLDSTCLMWFYISWVFSWPEMFKSTKQLVVMNYQGPENFELNGLPPQGFLGKLTSHFCV